MKLADVTNAVAASIIAVREPDSLIARSESANGVEWMPRSVVVAAAAVRLATSWGGWTVTNRKTSVLMPVSVTPRAEAGLERR
jgi:hypothetical protein